MRRGCERASYDLRAMTLYVPEEFTRDEADVLRRYFTNLDGPVFAHATVVLDEPADLSLDTRSWGKGVAFVNGFALGRYWTRGPQHTLYVPAPVLRAEGNEILVLVLDAAAPQARFVEDLGLGHTEQ